MVEFSCHDATILALASLLGVEVDAPFFAGHWLFELHQSSAGAWSVRVIYNADPTTMEPGEFLELPCWTLPLDEVYLPLRSCARGATDADAFLSYLETHCGMGNTAGSANGLRAAVSALRAARDGSAEEVTAEDKFVQNPMGSLKSVLGEDRLNNVFAQLKAGSSDMPQGKRRDELELAFNAADANHTGRLSMFELATLLRCPVLPNACFFCR
jgi:hypothetical protein